MTTWMLLPLRLIQLGPGRGASPQVSTPPHPIEGYKMSHTPARVDVGAASARWAAISRKAKARRASETGSCKRDLTERSSLR